MGRFSKGMLGPVSGTVGPVVGSSWKNVAYMRSQPLVKKRTSTADQIDHQLRFSIVINFVNALTPIIQLTFKKYAVRMSQNNAAVSYNYNNAVTGKAPDYVIDYTKALVSRGDLPNATAPAATVTGGQVYFTWKDNSQVLGTNPLDQAVLVAFCPGLNQAISTNSDGTRNSGSATLDVSPFAGQTIETWIAFITVDGEDASNSFYTGELVVS